jgi:hypothetical protein
MLTRTAIFAAAFLAGAGAAQAATFNFDSFASNVVVNSFDLGGGFSGSLSVTNNDNPTNLPSEARTFDATLTGTADPDLENPFENSDNPGELRRFGKVLIIQELSSRTNTSPDDERRGGTITFNLDNAINLTGLTFLDGEEGASVFAGMTASGTAIGVFDGASDNQYTTIDFSGAAVGISAFTIEFNGSGALAEIFASVPGGPTNVIPLPAGAWLLLGGLGALGAAKRRRRAA